MRTEKFIWTDHPDNSISLVKRLLAFLSLKVRKQQLDYFLKIIQPSLSTSVLDIGVGSNEELPDTNYFEKHYPFPEKLMAYGVEDLSSIQNKYPNIHFIQGSPGKKLAFKDQEFDVVTSWATLEHVGDASQQKEFLLECLRIGKNVFITVPYRGCFYEPHTGFFFLHWLPLTLFREICYKLGKPFWANVQNLNPIYIRNIREMVRGENIKLKIKTYKMFGILPSHLIIIKTQ